MIKITATTLVAAAMLAASSAFAGDQACCAKGASNAQSMACVNLAALNLTPDQKTKIETWQAECMKAGCTKESRQTFLGRAKGILSPQQFVELKAQCKKAVAPRRAKPDFLIAGAWFPYGDNCLERFVRVQKDGHRTFVDQFH